MATEDMLVFLGQLLLWEDFLLDASKMNHQKPIEELVCVISLQINLHYIMLRIC